MYNYNDELYHYGVKGMKWGVRRAASENARKAYKETLSSTSRIGNSHYARVRKAKKAGQQAYIETVKTAKEAKKTEKVLEKQLGKLEDSYVYSKNPSKKDMYKAYGQIEDSLTYNKRSNKKANEYAEKALLEIDKQLTQTGKKPTYDAKKVNDFLDEALISIEDQRRLTKKIMDTYDRNSPDYDKTMRELRDIYDSI